MTAPALVIGAGPAGLMAAERLAEAGLSVIVAEAKPSLGRKFLMAGKSGLNITKDEPRDAFIEAFSDKAEALSPMLAEWAAEETMAWCEALGQPVFRGSSGRVFPVARKASPLLRAWAARLQDKGVALRTRWRWTGWSGAETCFDTPEGPVRMTPSATVLALGGASWSRLGSDGAWTGPLAEAGVPLTPFAPANMGITVRWTPPMTRHLGTPVKGITLTAGPLTSRGEVVISGRGLEGGGLYAVSRAVRNGAPLHIDLLPDHHESLVSKRLEVPQQKASLSNFLRKSLRLPPVKVALLREFGHPMPDTADARARLIKALPIHHAGPRPMDEAISVAGGVAWHGLDPGLMLEARPGVFCAGEMLDWEAPTGGYLITGCLATGRWAGDAAARWARRR